jgi:hypothetical protein
MGPCLRPFILRILLCGFLSIVFREELLVVILLEDSNKEDPLFSFSGFLFSTDWAISVAERKPLTL